MNPPVHDFSVDTPWLVETFLALTRVDTTSQPGAVHFPSTPGQVELGRQLVAILQALGLEEVCQDSQGLVTATLPANLPPDEPLSRQIPVIGLIAHMDTSNQAPGGPVNARIHRNYQGGDLVLAGGTVIPARELEGYAGCDVITSDGTTLLGADDKAGIAEILEAVRILRRHPEIRHPKVRVAFTPDEETMEYIHRFDIEAFGADYAYTLDINPPNTIATGTFNACKMTIAITGTAIHTSAAAGILVNPAEVVAEFIHELGRRQRFPARSRHRQGFTYVWLSEANAEVGRITLNVRDFRREGLEKRVQSIERLVAEFRQRYPASTITVETLPQYSNLHQALKNHPRVVRVAERGMRQAGLTPQKYWLRGGTDGAVLSLKGLPAPNIGCGGRNYHSRRECISVQEMALSTANIVHILNAWTHRT